MVQQHGLGALLPHEVWRALLIAGTVRRFAAGEALMWQGDPGAFVLTLTRGQVKVTRIEPQGDQLLLAIRGPGEIIGELSVLDGTARSASVIALSSCITYVLSAARFLRIINEFHVEDLVLRHILTRYREGEDVRAELAELPAPDRVARVLVRLVSAIEGPDPGIDVSQEELAGAAGLSRASFAAELKELRRQGLVATRRRRLVIRDLPRLRATAGLE